MKYTESAIQVFVPKNYFILFFHKRSCQNHSLIMPSSFPFLQLSLHYRNTIISNQLRPTIIFILSLKINCRLLAMLIKITFITISSSTQQALLTITSMFPISGATINSAESVIVSAMKMDLPPVCQPEKKVKAKSFSKISLSCSMLPKSIQTFFRRFLMFFYHKCFQCNSTLNVS